MKRFLIPLLATAIATLFAFGCKQETTVTDTGTTSTTSTTATDTSATYSSTDTAMTGTTASTTTSTPASPEEQKFIMEVANGGLAEVSMGQLASTNAQNADVKAFGQRMVTDHGAANDELKQLATAKGVTVPAQLDAEHQKKHDDLAKKTGAAFDKAYMDEMVKDHEKDVAAFKKESTSATDSADLKAWVTKTLPTLEDHLKMAKETQKKVK